jgi:predicted nucleic acid-binding protein
LFSYVEESDSLHERAIAHIESLSTDPEVYTPSVVLHEFDAVLKTNHVGFDERRVIFEELSKVIPDGKVLRTTASIMKLAADLDKDADWRGHYFDAAIVACALQHSADIMTTDGRMPRLGVRTEW